jgi:monoamine oxidase
MLRRMRDVLVLGADAADPWRHPDAAALDAISLAAWLRGQGARPAVLRLHERLRQRRALKEGPSRRSTPVATSFHPGYLR